MLLTHKCYTGEGRAAGDFARCFEPYLIQESRSKNVVFHASLNPAEGDHLTDTQLIQIAEEYMQKMGYVNQPYIVIKHADIDREHIHIISVRVDKNGKTYFGIVYSAIDENGKPTGKPLKSSLFGRFAGHTALQKRFWKSAQMIKKDGVKEQARLTVDRIMRQYPDRKTFEQELKKKGIDVIFRENAQGRIYGVTFIDHNSRFVCNGSQLGKEYSANAFHDYFSAPARSLLNTNDLRSQKIEQPSLYNNDFTGLSFENLSCTNDYTPLPDDTLLREQRKKKKGLHL